MTRRFARYATPRERLLGVFDVQDRLVSEPGLRGRARENPEVIVLAHGGPISSAEDTRYLYEHTDAQGFLGASSMERIPVEAAIIDAVRAFKARRPRAGVGDRADTLVEAR